MAAMSGRGRSDSAGVVVVGFYLTAGPNVVGLIGVWSIFAILGVLLLIGAFLFLR
jgi:hypothetical protein